MPPATQKRRGGRTALKRPLPFTWDKPSFPGTIIAGQFQEFKSDEAGIDLHVFFKPTHQTLGADIRRDGGQGSSPTTSPCTALCLRTTLNVVEIPDDTVPSAWAPEIAALASRAITDKINYRLLANTIAHQWWGDSVSPASKDDWWLSDGFARYSEALYVEHAAGTAGLEEAVKECRSARWPTTLCRFECRQAGYLLARISVAGDRQGRDDPAHAALGDWRPEIRPDHAHFRQQVRGQDGIRR